VLVGVWLWPVVHDPCPVSGVSHMFPKHAKLRCRSPSLTPTRPPFPFLPLALYPLLSEVGQRILAWSFSFGLIPSRFRPLSFAPRSLSFAPRSLSLHFSLVPRPPPPAVAGGGAREPQRGAQHRARRHEGRHRRPRPGWGPCLHSEEQRGRVQQGTCSSTTRLGPVPRLRRAEGTCAAGDVLVHDQVGARAESALLRIAGHYQARAEDRGQGWGRGGDGASQGGRGVCQGAAEDPMHPPPDMARVWLCVCGSPALPIKEQQWQNPSLYTAWY
jgi:hypothetical protein